jgi:hypothetical protein
VAGAALSQQLAGAAFPRTCDPLADYQFVLLLLLSLTIGSLQLLNAVVPRATTELHAGRCHQGVDHQPRSPKLGFLYTGVNVRFFASNGRAITDSSPSSHFTLVQWFNSTCAATCHENLLPAQVPNIIFSNSSGWRTSRNK